MTLALPLETVRARTAVAGAFFVTGLNVANFVSRIPDLKASLGLDDGGLGLTLLGMSVGTLTAIFIAGYLVARFGSRRVTITGAVFMSLILPLLAVMTTAPALWGALFLFGAALSVSDVGMNAQAVQVERGWGRSIMSSFHATYSIGGLIGALTGALFVQLKIEPRTHFAIMGIFSVLAMVAIMPRLLVLPPTAKPVNDQRRSPVTLPHPALWGLGAIAFCAFLSEGAIGDWSGVYMRDTLRIDASIAAFGYAAFSLTMTIFRLLGDRITARLSAKMITRWGGALAASGMLAALGAQLIDMPTLRIAIALIGFGVVGIGLSIIVPLAFSAAGNKPGFDPEMGLAGVATLGYAGLLAGPPVIGLVAQISSISFALLFIVGLCVALVFLASAHRRA